MADDDQVDRPMTVSRRFYDYALFWIGAGAFPVFIGSMLVNHGDALNIAATAKSPTGGSWVTWGLLLVTVGIGIWLWGLVLYAKHRRAERNLSSSNTPDLITRKDSPSSSSRPDLINRTASQLVAEATALMSHERGPWLEHYRGCWLAVEGPIVDVSHEVTTESDTEAELTTVVVRYPLRRGSIIEITLAMTFDGPDWWRYLRTKKKGEEIKARGVFVTLKSEQIWPTLDLEHCEIIQ